MTDAEFEAARAAVNALWDRYASLRDAAALASSEWVQASHELRAESKAREIDRLIAERQKVAERHPTAADGSRDSAVLHLAMARARLIAEKASD